MRKRWDDSFFRLPSAANIAYSLATIKATWHMQSNASPSKVLIQWLQAVSIIPLRDAGCIVFVQVCIAFCNQHNLIMTRRRGWSWTCALAAVYAAAFTFDGASKEAKQKEQSSRKEQESIGLGCKQTKQCIRCLVPSLTWVQDCLWAQSG